MRLPIVIKLMFFASMLAAIPFIGYHYIWDMEKYLRQGQEQTLMNNAQALATALHERKNLFNEHASYKEKLIRGKDFFPTEITSPIQLDGKNNDWQGFTNERNINFYNSDFQIGDKLPSEQVSLSFTANIGRLNDYVYAFFKVSDNKVIYRGKNSLSVVNNDHLEIATINNDNQLIRYVISNHNPGWVSAYQLPKDDAVGYPAPENKIQGQWLPTNDGYNIEIRIPKSMLGKKLGFSITDIDTDTRPFDKVVIGTADTKNQADLGTFTVPSPRIEAIIKAMARTHSSIKVLDKHYRILTEHGDIQKATGELQNRQLSSDDSWFTPIKQWLNDPIYNYFLTKPSEDFVSNTFDNRVHSNKHVNTALAKGQLDTAWWTTPDNKAVILSAAHPIFIDGKIEGVVIVEETTHGIRGIRNQAMEGVILTSFCIFISVIALLIYTLRLSYRIRKLRNQTDAVIDENGRIKASMSLTSINDEVGDLNKSFAHIIDQLTHNNNYLQNMSSRLSHELKTPVSVVRSSLEHLQQYISDDDSKIYLQRAQDGISRLNSMLMAMSEANSLEQSLQTSLQLQFDMAQLVEGCSKSYMQIYPEHEFALNIVTKPLLINGSDEHIAQLFDKLISNAVEFSNTDKPISIELTTIDNFAKLTVTNFGPKLPKNMLNSIFDSMVSVRNEQQNKQPHLGIGLYICRLIATHHKGKIYAENNDESGSVSFTLLLPTN